MDTTKQDLTQFVSSLTGGDVLRVEESLGSGYVRLRVAEAERRQAKHDIQCVEDAVIELLRNSRDAQAQAIFVGIAREQNLRTIHIVDDGCGIPAEMQRKVFDARVTSKLDTMGFDKWGVHGRGMALYSIRENALSARVVTSQVGYGTAMAIAFDCDRISEKTDQSTWPQVQDKGGSVELTGPRNIIRTCVEFALECEQGVKVYVGSPSEMIATMRRRIRPRYTSAPADIELPARAVDARELRDAAARLGVDMSERTAHRIIRSEIAPLRNARDHAMRPRATTRSRTQVRERRLQLSTEDRAAFTRSMEDAFADLAERYYVTLSGQPTVKVMNGRITVSFAYVDDD